MAAGKPVVVTSVGGVTDAVTHGISGIVVPADDPAPLVDALKTLEADPSLRIRLGEAGRKAVSMKFSQESVIEKLMSLYEMLADHRRATRSERADA
jgi:glycosyltransferase involved in cell wall biosynthesis